MFRPGRRRRAAEGLPRRRAAAAAGDGLGVVGGGEGPTAVVRRASPLPRRLLRNARCRPRLDRRRDQGRVPASWRSSGTRIATPATRRPRSGSRSWRSPMRCCPTRTSAATTIASAPSTARPVRGDDITGATEFFDALFGDLFGLQRRRSSAGRDLRYTLELDFEEAALGCEKTIVFERPEDCGACHGTGAEGGSAGLVTCTRCGGEGVIRKKAGFLTSRRDCMGCGGTGQVPRVRCANCEGAGLVDRERALHRPHPAGVDGRVDPAGPARGRPGAAGRAARRSARDRARAPAPVLQPRDDARRRRAGRSRRRSRRSRRRWARRSTCRCWTAACACACRRGRRRGRSSGCAARDFRARGGARRRPRARRRSRRRRSVSDEARALLEKLGAALTDEGMPRRRRSASAAASAPQPRRREPRTRRRMTAAVPRGGPAQAAAACCTPRCSWPRS